MKILADENMPLVREWFGRHGEVSTLPGRAIDTNAVRGADVLLVRSVTRVDAALLAGSRVKFVGSATSGHDHVDCAGLATAGIRFAHAPGCNAGAVVQYVLSVCCALRPDWRRRVIGIVGCGAVGGRLYRVLTALGVRCRVHDPLLSDPETIPDLTDLAETVRAADILCLHTPLTHAGSFPTFHMVNDRMLAALKPGCLLINAARGAVVDNPALRERLATADLTAALDVWEGEPAVDPGLWRRVAIATPHIAGYSREGRVNGTRAVYEAFCAWQGINPMPLTPEPAQPLAQDVGTLADAVLATFDVRSEHRRMAAAIASGAAMAEVFDRLRRTSPERREFGHFQIAVTGDDPLAAELRRLGFRVSVE
ncbi:MAG: 4-phosphoerythronate dehydrogenase [Gammaproteobacteria bacterium]|nr:4-phosphoerythronate dehydrogenase [Gammaproteobacteria bacterium]